MRDVQQQSVGKPDGGKKPDRPRGPIGLWIYGALTILGGIALFVVAE